MTQTQGDVVVPGSAGASGRILRLAKDTFLYGGIAMLGRALALLTFPVLTRHLGPDQYGSLDLASLITGTIAIAMVFGQDSAVARYFYEWEDRASRRRLISQSLAVQVLLMLLILPVIWSFSDRIGRGAFDTDCGGQWIRLIVLQVPCVVLLNFSTNILRWSMKRTQYVALTLGSAVLQAVVLTAVALCDAPSVATLLEVGLMTYAVFSALGLTLVREWIVVPRDFSLARATFAFAWPVGLVCLAGTCTPTIERAVTGRMYGTEDLGQIAVAAKVASLLYLCVSAFQAAWGPFAISVHRHADAEVLFRRVYVVGSAAVCAGALALTGCATPLIRLLASAKFEPASVAVLPLALAIAVQAATWTTEIGITIAKRNHLQIAPFVLQAVASLGLLALMPRSVGLLGVGFAVLAGQVVKCVLTCRASSSAHAFRWPHAAVAAIFAATAVCGVLVVWISSCLGPSVGGLVAAIVASALLIATWRFALTEADRARLTFYLRGLRTRSPHR